jgi:hypothetical protein
VRFLVINLGAWNDDPLVIQAINREYRFMGEIVSLPLALLDFVPVACFLIGGWYMSLTAGLLCSQHVRQAALIGMVLVAAGGAAKATAKLVSAAGLGNIDQVGELHFMLQSPGFLILLVSAVYMLRAAKIPLPKLNPVLALAPWKIPLIAMMALTGTALHGILAGIALQRKARAAAAGFALALVCLLAMGVAAQGERTIAMQWVEESINTLGQVGYATGSYLLYRSFATQGSGPQPGPATVRARTTHQKA